MKRVFVVGCLFICACAGRRVESIAVKSSPAVKECMDHLEIFSGPVMRRYKVLGEVQGDRALARPSRKADRIDASRAACQAHPRAQAIINYQGVIKDDHAWWSGVVVKWE